MLLPLVGSALAVGQAPAPGHCAARTEATGERPLLSEPAEGASQGRQLRLETLFEVQEYCLMVWVSEGHAGEDLSLVVVLQVVDGGPVEVFRREYRGADVRFVAEGPGRGVGADLTGNGEPNVILASEPRAGCCPETVVLELGTELSVIFDDYVGNGFDPLSGEPDPTTPTNREFIDLDGDGSFEIVAVDLWPWSLGCEQALGIEWTFITVLSYDPWLRRYSVASARFEEAFREEITLGERFANEAPHEPCGALRLAMSLFSADRPAEAWRAFTEQYRGPAEDAWLSWLQAELLSNSPWRYADLNAIAGRWSGELARFVRWEEGGEFELMGGGSMIEVEFYGEAPLNRPVGLLSHVTLDFAPTSPSRPTLKHCTLLRGPDLRYGPSVVQECEPGGRYEVGYEPQYGPFLRAESEGGRVITSTLLTAVDAPQGRTGTGTHR